MSSNLVIVALPADDDPIWKVSSEKKPHLTMLSLGDAESNPHVDRIFQFVSHAVNISEHGPFYLDVDHRGILGADQADVLHFRKDWSFKWVNQFRNQLLQNTDIRAAYESVEQYPEWDPHLTLGYPETPAHEDKMPEHGIHMVRFDRIAVWTGDFEGPWFRLEWQDREFGDVMAMSGTRKTGEEAVADLLHVGVKGMKWGVRKVDNGGEIRINNKTGMASPSKSSTVALVGTAVIMPPVIPALFLSKRFRSEIKATRAHNKQVQADKKDAKDLQTFEKKARSAEGFVAIHNGAADHFNREIEGINKKYPEDLTKNPARQKQYDAEVQKMMQDAYRKSANSLTNKKATHHVDLEFVNDGMDFKIHVKEGAPTPMLEHAAGDDVTFAGKIKRGPTGHIVDLVFDDFEPAVKHASDLGAEFLEHHGIKGSMAQSAMYGEAFAEGLMHYGMKGMRWGVRKPPPSPVAPTAASRVPHGAKRKTQIEVDGGENHPAHTDAIKVAEAKAKLAKSGPAALSNQELRDVANRVQLEQQVVQLTRPAARRFVRNLLGQQGSQAANQVVGKQVKKKLATAALI